MASTSRHCHRLGLDVIGPLAASGFVIFLLLAHTAMFRVYITDDAFIAFRYVRSFVHDEGLTYNAGERVWGFTSLLWCALLVPFAWSGFDLAASARFLGFVCNVLLLVVVLRYRSTPEASRGASRWTALLLASNGAFVLQGINGMETALFSLLFVLAVREYGNVLERGAARRLTRVGALAALVAMTRPEGALLMLCLLAHLVVRGNGIGRYLAACVPVFAIFLFAMHGYYAAFWPNTINAKVGVSVEQLLRGFHYLGAFTVTYPVHMVLLGLATVAMARTRPGDRLIMAATWALLLFYAAAGGNWMLGYRLYHPALVLSAMLLPPCLGLLAPATRMRHATLLTAGLMMLCAATLAPSWIDRRVQAAKNLTYVHRGVVIGTWMRANLPRGSLLATNTAGTIAYYSDLPIVDMMGLTDRVIAARPDVPSGWKGIEKGDGAYVLSRKPAYIQFGSSSGSEEPVFLSDIEIFVSPEFWRRYRRMTVDVPRAGRLVMYARREGAGPDPSAEEWARISEVAHRRIRSSAFRY